jgi:Protein of unknown function (DUF1553)/Protein of unknown function (DUF1549)
MRLLAVLVMICVTAAASEPIVETPIDDYDREHWAFQPVKVPAIPEVHNKGWSRTRIDRFILARLEAESLEPAAEADRETLIRRLCFDLHGLPPTIDQLHVFLNDDRPDAYARFVEGLLSAPEYGQRWAQFWLDLARFAETDGFEHDELRESAWKYRDWVIEAFNRDLPLNEFIAQQIAGDVLDPNNPDAAIPTVFGLAGPDMPDLNSQDERKHVLMNEVTATVGAVLLSMQIGCAQCHDHKYDAISQADFYRLRAFFDPAVKLSKGKSIHGLDADADPSYISHLLERGDWRSPGPRVFPAFPRIANITEQSVTATTAGEQRLQLANWLTDPEHPLTARSLVNRVWQFHFGHGLSRSPSDFGVMGQEPTHPELLDHLAAELVGREWSLKDLHREILLSATYRTNSQLSAGSTQLNAWTKLLQADPENRLLGRFSRRRLDAEAIRDALFAVSGSLNHEVDGPGVSPPLPEEMIKTLKSGQWKTSERTADHYRRSVFIFARRNLRYPLFATFDRPAADCSCAQRQPSTTAIQSLLLLNSELTLDAAKRLAEVVAVDRSTQIDQLYRRLFARSPTQLEYEECRQFWQDQTELLQGDEQQALVDLCRAMLNANQFLYVD